MPTEAFDLIESPPEIDTLPGVVIFFGEDATLRTWVLRLLTSNGDAETVEGETSLWRDIRDEVSTVSLFDSGQRRVVIVREGDTLVKKFRPEIEDYVAKPSSAGRLILELKTLASNTRLYKATDKQQLLVHCGVPKTQGKSKAPDSAKLRKFLTGTIAPRHQCKLNSGAADLLVDLIGSDIGMLDTEVAKVALYTDPGGKIDESMIRDIVGGWKANTIWQVIDAAAGGDAAEALKQLDKMMSSGEQPIALLSQLAWSMRRLALATAAVDYAEQTGRRPSVSDALKAAGVTYDTKKAEGQLRQLGRHRGRQLLHWLLEADLKLKGSHSTSGPDRFVLEEFVLKLAKS